MNSLERIKELLSVDSNQQDITWVIAGDSITHGALHLFGCRDYPQLFEERVRYELGRHFDAVIRTAISGWRTDLILGDIERRILRYKPQVLSMMIGMNDCALSNEMSAQQFEDNYNSILDQAGENSNPALILHTPNLIMPEAMEQRGRLGEFAEVVRKIASQRQAVLVDHYSAWETATEKGLNIVHWMNDSIHPNNFGHIAFVQEMCKALDIFDEKSNVCRFYKP